MKINDKTKIIFLFLGTIVLFIISIIVMVGTVKDSKKEIVIEDERIENIDLTDFENEDIISTVIINNLDNKGANRGCKLLSKYSEDYVSVMQWMLVTVCDKMNNENFTVYISGEEEWDFTEVNGLEFYGSAENYLTELFLNNPNSDISDILFEYCPDEYYALKNTYLLGKEANREYGISDSQSTFQNLIQLYYKGEYDTILSEIDTLLETYKLTMPYNYPLCNLYQDAKSAKDYGYDTSGYIYGLDFMHLPETYISNFLKLTNSEKASYIWDENSVLPFAFTHGIITGTFEVEESEYIQFKNIYPDKFTENTEIRGYNFYIGGTQGYDDNYYKIVILCDLQNNRYQVISLKSSTENTLYKTITELKGTDIITEINSQNESETIESEITRPEPVEIYNDENSDLTDNNTLEEDVIISEEYID